mmetsp:Transcript_26820/g.77538  ORF Transcript_26820/g.77538 Transcript_26820/m.77538 type:complete len:265 (-) Transcript_26820:562-1356(-)
MVGDPLHRLGARLPLSLRAVRAHHGHAPDDLPDRGVVALHLHHGLLAGLPRAAGLQPVLGGHHACRAGLRRVAERLQQPDRLLQPERRQAGRGRYLPTRAHAANEPPVKPFHERHFAYRLHELPATGHERNRPGEHPILGDAANNRRQAKGRPAVDPAARRRAGEGEHHRHRAAHFVASLPGVFDRHRPLHRREQAHHRALPVSIRTDGLGHARFHERFSRADARGRLPLVEERHDLHLLHHDDALVRALHCHRDRGAIWRGPK